MILGAGDPDMVGGKDVITAMFEAGITLTTLMNELAEERRANPTDDLTSALVHTEVGEDMLAPNEIAPVLHPARGRRQRHHPHRHDASGCTC